METKQYPDMECDVVIAGCGVAGLYAALNLPTSTRVIMLSKGAVDECDSMLAQGGICVLPEGSDYDAFFEGHHARRPLREPPRECRHHDSLEPLGHQRPAGDGRGFRAQGRRQPRLYPRGRLKPTAHRLHADITGKEITTKLLQAVRKLDNVQILEHVAMTDILTGERDGATVCTGVVAVSVDEDNSVRPADELANAAEGVHAGEPFKIHARHTLWATGGSAAYTTIRPTTRSSRAMPATLLRSMALRWSTWTTCRSTPRVCSHRSRAAPSLISESCRGEGAILLQRRRRALYR